MAYLYLSVAILIEIIATTCLKASNGFTHLGFTVVSLIGYGVSFYCLSIALRAVSVGIAYAIWSGVGTVGICLLGWIFYQQKLSIMALFGVCLIILGVIIINLGQTQYHS